jgi:D-methionine transport system ATP-binding protein
VKKLANHVAVIEGGAIVEQGSTYDIFANPRHETTRRFVGSVTGGNAPDWLLAQLKPDYHAGDSAVLQISFAGIDADQPVLSRISRTFNIDVNILHGQVESIAEHGFGSLIVSVPAGGDQLQRIIQQVRAGSNKVEHLGYVA